MIKLKITAILLAGAMAFTLAACGSSDTTESTESESASASETAVPSESETAEPSEPEDEDRLAPDGVWETDGERVTIEGDTVTIDHIDDEGEVTETYWVGSFELGEDSDTWTSTRDPNAEMTCESETIKFTWSGEGDNVYDKLSYAVTNEDGTKTTVTLDRVESLGDVEKGVVPDFEDSSNGDTSSTSASPSTSNSKNSDTASANDTTSASASAGNNSNNDSSDNSGNTNTNTNNNNNSTNTNNNNNGSSGNNSGSGSTNTNTGNSSSNSSSSGSSGRSGSSSSSGNTGTTATACSHNYQGVVTKNATCSSAGVKTYTCSKCGASYTESIPATGNHNWQAVYKTVHHDATGHYETTAVYETRYCCGTCGWYQEDVTGMSTYEQSSYLQYEHSVPVHGYPGNYYTAKVQVGITQTWVVDSDAYDEQIVDYYKCSACGATK